jgi:hypothetical protein
MSRRVTGEPRGSRKREESRSLGFHASPEAAYPDSRPRALCRAHADLGGRTMSRLSVVLSALGLVALALPFASAQRGERPAKPVEEPVPANPAPPPAKQADKGTVVERVGVGAASTHRCPS